MCVSGGKNVWAFLKDVMYVLNEWSVEQDTLMNDNIVKLVHNSNIEILGFTLRKICQNMGFLWPEFSSRTESKILSLYGKLRIKENPHCDLFYAKLISIILTRWIENEWYIIFRRTTRHLNWKTLQLRQRGSYRSKFPLT